MRSVLIAVNWFIGASGAHTFDINPMFLNYIPTKKQILQQHMFLISDRDRDFRPKVQTPGKLLKELLKNLTSFHHSSTTLSPTANTISSDRSSTPSKTLRRHILRNQMKMPISSKLSTKRPLYLGRYRG
jgi:hypothetical protein